MDLVVPSNQATFYLTLLLQQSSLGFLHVLMRITDLLNFFFRIKAINKFYIKISEKSWLKNEPDTYDYGYYYALYSTLINIVVTFGVQVPLLYIGLVITLSLKLFADGVKITNVHGWDIEGSGRLHELALTRIQFGTLIPHILYANQCFWNKNWRTMIVNLFMIVYSIVMVVLLKKNRLAHLQPSLRILRDLKFQEVKKRDIVNWVFRYSHPYIRVMGPKEAMPLINEMNSPVSYNPELNPSLQNQIRFNRPIPGDSPLRLASTPFVQDNDVGGASKKESKKFTFSESSNLIKASQGEDKVDSQQDKDGSDASHLAQKDKYSSLLMESDLSQDSHAPYHFKKDWENIDQVVLKSPIFMPHGTKATGLSIVPHQRRLSNVPELAIEEDLQEHFQPNEESPKPPSHLVPPLGLSKQPTCQNSRLPAKSQYDIAKTESLPQLEPAKTQSKSERNSPAKLTQSWFSPNLLLSKKTTKISILGQDPEPQEDGSTPIMPATGFSLEISNLEDDDLKPESFDIPLEPGILTVGISSSLHKGHVETNY